VVKGTPEPNVSVEYRSGWGTVSPIARVVKNSSPLLKKTEEKDGNKEEGK